MRGNKSPIQGDGFRMSCLIVYTTTGNNTITTLTFAVTGSQQVSTVTVSSGDMAAMSAAPPSVVLKQPDKKKVHVWWDE